MTRPPRLISSALILRAPGDTDAAERLVLGHDPHIIHMFGGAHIGGDPSAVAPMTHVEAVRWLDRVREHISATDRCRAAWLPEPCRRGEYTQ